MDQGTPLQRFIRDAVAAMPEARDHYDRLLQAKLSTKGKPIYDIDRGKSRNPSLAALTAIAEVLGQPRELLEKAMSGDEVVPVARLTTRSAVEAGPSSKAPEQPHVVSADAGETVEIIQLDLSLPMGTGATVDDYIEEEPRVFDLAYIRGFTRTEASRLRLARGVGDSMWPTLQSYDQVWIDSTQRELNQNDRIWAVSINGAAAIKRLRKLKGGRVLVISDNPGPGHDNYEVGQDEIMIGGRVIRFARDL